MNERITQLLEKLGDLYSKTGYDWRLSVSHSLSEPTCPTANVFPEMEDGHGLMRYAAWGNTIEEAIERSLDMAYRELILGEEIKIEAPWTNPIDHRWEELKAEFAKNAAEIEQRQRERNG